MQSPSLTRREFGKLGLAGATWLSLGGCTQAHDLTPLDVARNGFYISRNTEAHRWCTSHPDHPDQPAILRQIAQRPAACWLTGHDAAAITENYLNRAGVKQQLGVLVAYNVPDRDAGQYSAGGARDEMEYLDWIQHIAQAIGRRACMVILEPDSLMLMIDRPHDQQAARISLLNRAIDIFAIHAPNVWLYADGGSGNWPRAEDHAPLLGALKMDKLRGFALNVSNYNTDEQCAAQANALMAALEAQGTPAKGWVFDTSRNGNGPAPDGAWCNPPGRKLGRVAALGTQGADANLWIKLPGESDGTCGAYPSMRAGDFSHTIARHLIEGT